MPKNSKLLLTTKDVATILKVSMHRVQALAKEGILVGEKVGRDWLFKKEIVEEFSKLERPSHRPKTKIRTSEQAYLSEREESLAMGTHPATTATVIACLNNKGGVGKTTTVTSLAAAFAEGGKRVLIVDNDPQGNASLQFGIDALDNPDIHHTIADVYQGLVQLHEAAVSTNFEGVYLVPATIELGRVEMNLGNQQGGDLKLRRAIAPARQYFDVILLDSSPHLGTLSNNIIAAADWYLIPINGAWASRSVEVILNSVRESREAYNTQGQLLGLVITMIDHTRVMASLREFNQETYADYLFKSEIRRSTVAREAEALGKPLMLYDTDSKLTQDYRALAQEIAPKIGLSLVAV